MPCSDRSSASAPDPDAHDAARAAVNGSAPDRSPVALLLVDVINAMEFDTGEALLRHAEPASHRIAALADRARAAGIPVIYANDNFGRWRADFREVVAHARRAEAPGAAIATRLAPAPSDYFVLKPKHSGFHETPLGLLLGHLGVRHLVLAGFAGDVCVLFTAHDAYMRDYALHVPSDCLASEDAEANAAALAHMRRVMHVDTTPSDALDLMALCAASNGG